MKTALCFSGELRSIDQCIAGWKEKILPNIDSYDSFYFGWEDDPEIDKLHYLSELNVKSIVLEKRATFKEKMYAIRKRPEVNVQGMLRQLYCLKRSNDLKSNYEGKNRFIYDCVIRMRPDLLIEPSAEFPNLNFLNVNKLHVFKHDKWFGFNDRMYFSNSENMNLLQNRINELDQYFLSGGLFHYETFFAAVAQKYGISTEEHDFRFKLLRANGSVSYCWENDSYWSKMWNYPYLGLYPILKGQA